MEVGLAEIQRADGKKYESCLECKLCVVSERHLQKSSSFQGPVFLKESQELQGPSCGVGKSQDVVKSCEVNGKDVVVFFLLKASSWKTFVKTFFAQNFRIESFGGI